jgi:hypothetical protein
MSALPPKADIVQCDCHVRFVPISDIRKSNVPRVPVMRMTEFALVCRAADRARGPEMGSWQSTCFNCQRYR